MKAKQVIILLKSLEDDFKFTDCNEEVTIINKESFAELIVKASLSSLLKSFEHKTCFYKKENGETDFSQYIHTVETSFARDSILEEWLYNRSEIKIIYVNSIKELMLLKEIFDKNCLPNAFIKKKAIDIIGVGVGPYESERLDILINNVLHFNNTL